MVGVEPGWFMEVFLADGMAAVFGGFPQIPDQEGYMTLCVPHWGNTPERVPFTAVTEDYGHVVHGVLLDPAKHNRKLVQAVSDIRSLEEVTQIFTKVTGKKARAKILGSAEELPTYGQSVMEDVRDMFRYLHRVEGKYFDGQETEDKTSNSLKADAFKAMGQSEDYALTSVEEFFKKHFGGK